MAIYRDAKLTVASTDISSAVRTLALNDSSEELDDTAMGDDTRTSAGGLLRWTIEGEANQTFGATGIDSVFATRVGTSVAVVVRPLSTSTALSEGNPKYSGSGIITEYVPMSGSVGDQFICTFSIVAGGTKTRSVS